MAKTAVTPKAVAWSIGLWDAARAQQGEWMRRIGALMPQAESDPVQRAWTSAFATRLRELGWVEDKSVRIDYRWAGGDMTREAALAKELVELQPNVLLGATSTAAQMLRQYTLAIPIVFTQVADPVAAGLVTNLTRPEGNITGFWWAGIVAPANTPPAIVTQLNRELRKIIDDPDSKSKLGNVGFEAFSSSPKELEDFVKVQLGKWGKMVKDAGIQPE